MILEEALRGCPLDVRRFDLARVSEIRPHFDSEPLRGPGREKTTSGNHLNFRS